MDKGAYILLLKNDECRIMTGARGEITFLPGGMDMWDQPWVLEDCPGFCVISG